MSEDEMPFEMSPTAMWQLLDERTVRMQVPPLPLEGMIEPLCIHLDFDTEMVDEIMQRLTVLRSQMLPAPQRN
jgi:hypothetical protein